MRRVTAKLDGTSLMHEVAEVGWNGSDTVAAERKAAAVSRMLPTFLGHLGLRG